MKPLQEAPTTEPTSDALQLMLSRRVLITVGSGGVGKTTTAAALGLLAAQTGRRTLVMTIDPAKRLAASLGLESLDHEPREMPAERRDEAGLAPGLFFAMMMDTKRAFDEMVLRYAPDGATADRVLSSHLYQQISARLAGSQEYAAMEKLHELFLADRFELLVLDTPPTANALDFLDAPQKMVHAVDSAVVSLLIDVYRRSGKVSVGLLSFGAAFIMRRLARFTGARFLDDIAGFLAELSSLLAGMRQRAAQTIELLRRADVGFAIVTSPDPRSVDEAIAFHDRLAASQMSLAGFIINRLRPRRDSALSQSEVVAKVAALGDLDTVAATRLAAVMLDSHERWQELARADERELRRLRDRCGEDHVFWTVPVFDEDVHSVSGLLRLGEHLAPLPARELERDLAEERALEPARSQAQD